MNDPLNGDGKATQGSRSTPVQAASRAQMHRARHAVQRTRLLMIGGGLALLALAAALTLTALRDNMVFFQSPSDIAAAPHPEGRLRIGGMVRAGSLTRDGLTVRFQVTDFVHDIPIIYSGMLPDLFREEQGVVAEGAFDAQGVFVADVILAKHDETYMPPEVADALKRAAPAAGSPNASTPYSSAPYSSAPYSSTPEEPARPAEQVQP